MAKDINYYLSLPWEFTFKWDSRDSIYIASVEGIKYCSSHGSNIKEAASNIMEALELYIESHLQDGDPVPLPDYLQEAGR